ncbi:MAG: hypothetical protein R2734_15540 [Nocardioides sp.]
MPALLKVQHGLFDRLVFSKIRDRFGGRVRFFISGASRPQPGHRRVNQCAGDR